MVNNIPYAKHIFICLNQRPEGARISCGEAHGSALIKEFKLQMQQQGIDLPIRTQRAGCFDLCEQGPNVIIYPDGILYGKVHVNDVADIVASHLVNGKPLERLMPKNISQ